MEVHMSNKGAQNAPPPKWDRVPQGVGWGAKPPPKWKFVRHGHRIYRTTTKIYLNMSVHSTTLAAQCPPTWATSPLWGHKPQKKGNDWPSAPRIIANSLWI